MSELDRPIASGPMTATTAPTRPFAPEPPPPGSAFGSGAATVATTLALAAMLVALPFVAKGGVDMTSASSGNTWADVALTLVGGAITAAGVVRARPGSRSGLAAIAALAALTALEALSILWSVTPDVSWLGVNQMLAYLAVFAAAATTARTTRTGWPAVIGAIALATTAICGWALLVKVFPASLAPGNQFGRLQAPFGYWNALGVNAGVGLPCLLWVGSRRGSGTLASVLAVPALTLVLTTLVLSYSRSADLAAVVAAGLWFALVPLRLRAAAIGAVAAVGALILTLWVLLHHALSDNNIAMSQQDHAGHILGIVCLAVILLIAAVGAGTRFALDHAIVSPQARRRRGTLLIGLVALVPIAAIVALALSQRGLTGEISHGIDELKSSSSSTGTTAGRVLQVGSSRPIYWHDALDVGRHTLLKGSGELGFALARQHWSTDTLFVASAHSFVFQTFADLGLLGLLVAAALFIAWAVETLRTLQPWRRWSALPEGVRREREAMISLTAAVIAFGIQSTIDWTWFFAGVSVPVLIAAGWVAGRGPLAAPARSAAPERAPDPSPRPSLLDRPAAAVAVLVIAAIALFGAWFQWQPLRSAQQISRAESASTIGEIRDAAQSADHLDPLSLQPLTILAALDQAIHQPAAQRDELVAATRRQPDNWSTWQALGINDYNARRYQDAINDLQHVVELDISPDFAHNQAAQLIERSQGALAAAAAKRGG